MRHPTERALYRQERPQQSSEIHVVLRDTGRVESRERRLAAARKYLAAVFGFELRAAEEVAR